MYQKENYVRVLALLPYEPPKAIWLRNTLSAKQKFVGGLIECITLHDFSEPVSIVSNDEGKLEKLPPNRMIYNGQDYIAGPAFISEYTEDGYSISLSQEKIDFYTEKFQKPIISVTSLKDNLSRECTFSDAWRYKTRDGRHPDSELAYLRADHDGYRWYNSVFDINTELVSLPLALELDEVYRLFCKDFPNLQALRDYCLHSAQPTGEPAEYNAYLVLENGAYWFRFILRNRDYNLYLHCLSKEALARQGINLNTNEK